jgi:hypothetical protein
MAAFARCVSPAPRAAWRALLEGTDEALAFQTPRWIDVLCATRGYRDASRLYETRDGRCLLVPMVRRVGVAWPLRLQASLPYGWGFGGILTSEALTASDVSGVLADLQRAPAGRVSLRPNPLSARVWSEGAPANVRRVARSAHVLDLGDGFARVATRFHSSARRAIRKAERSALTITCETSGEQSRATMARTPTCGTPRARVEAPTGRRSSGRRVPDLGRLAGRPARGERCRPAPRRLRQLLARCDGH